MRLSGVRDAQSRPRFRGINFAAARERIEPAFAKRLRRGSLRLLHSQMRQSVYASASLQLRRTRFDLTVLAWLRHA